MSIISNKFARWQIIIPRTSSKWNFAGDPQGEGGGGIHVCARDGSISLNQHKDKESGKQTKVGRCDWINLFVVTYEDEYYDRYQNRHYEQFRCDVTPEDWITEVAQWRTKLKRRRHLSIDGYDWKKRK